MKEQEQKQALVLKSGNNTQSVGMTLDSESTHVLMQMLSKNLYSDPVGSTVRETVSNALDSHRRIGSKEPILVKLDKSIRNTFEFSVEDFGAGLDNDDVENIISKYGKSTKRNTNDELGMFGLGFKSPLSYSSSFIFIARKNGIERKYMMYEDEHNNKIDLLYEKETSEKNGVKIIITLQNNTYEYSSFISAMQTQLAYFSDVYISSNFLSNFKDSYKILRTANYQHSELCTDRYLHLCLDDVYYPIDFKKLGIPSIPARVGLRFSLSDGIFPTPNREAIKYTEEAKKIILDKIKNIGDEIITKYNTTVKDSIDIHKNVTAYKSQNNIYVNIGTEDIRVDGNLKDFKNISTVPLIVPEMPGTTILKTADFAKYHMTDILCDYKILHKILPSGNFYNVKADSHEATYFFDNRYGQKNVYYLVDSELDKLTKKYLTDLHKGYTIYFIRKTRSTKLKKKDSNDYNNLMSIFSLDHLKRNPKKLLNTLRDINLARKNLIKSRFNLTSEIVVPESFIKSLATAPKIATSKAGIKLKNKGEIICKTMVPGYGYQSIKMQSSKIDLNTVESTKSLYVYCKHNDKPIENLMKKVYYILPEKSIVNFITVSDREINNINKNPSHNIITWETFISGKNSIAQGLFNFYFYLNIDLNIYPALFKNKEVIAEFNTDLYGFASKLETIYQKHRYYGSRNNTMEVLAPIVTAMLTAGYYDRETFYKYEYYKDFLDKNKYIPLLYDFRLSEEKEKELNKLLICFQKKNHIRVNNHLYNIKK